jgi:peptidyl-prolyl cis-trans isomerase C
MPRVPGSRVALLLLTSATLAFSADADVVAHVGSATITASALARKLTLLPDFQRRALGDSATQLKRRVLDTMLIPDTLYALEADRVGLREEPLVKNRIRDALGAALERTLREERAKSAPLSDQEIASYYDANKARFSSPKRIRIYRILVDDPALAATIIKESGGTDGLQRWSSFAREKSLDKATYLRDGDLGFVRPDGNTDAPTLRVDPALFAAADTLADGAIAAEPLREGDHWAVIWRRGSLAAVERSLQQESAAIRQLLERKQSLEARATLLGGLQAKYVGALNDAVLDTAPLSFPAAPSREHAPLTPHPALAGSTAPVPGEDGRR